MVMVNDSLGNAYSMDGYLYNSLSSAKKVMAVKDVDLIIMVSGYPGTGKTTIASQIACFVDPTFNESRLCLTTERFIEEVKQAKPLQAVVLDESYEGLNSAEIRKEVGRALLNLLNIVRQQRLYIIILIPNFFDMSKQIACFRSRWLVHTYDRGFGNVGYYCLFDKNTKHDLYIKGKKFENYNSVKADFHCSFSPFIPKQINYKKYLENKAFALQNLGSKEKSTNALRQRNKLIIYMLEVLNISQKEMAHILGLSSKTIQRVTSGFLDEPTSLGIEYQEMIEREAAHPNLNKRFPLKQ